jgi:hypothetical protein
MVDADTAGLWLEEQAAWLVSGEAHGIEVAHFPREMVDNSSQVWKPSELVVAEARSPQEVTARGKATRSASLDRPGPDDDVLPYF